MIVARVAVHVIAKLELLTILYRAFISKNNHFVKKPLAILLKWRIVLS